MCVCVPRSFAKEIYCPRPELMGARTVHYLIKILQLTPDERVKLAHNSMLKITNCWRYLWGARIPPVYRMVYKYQVKYKRRGKYKR